MTNTTNLQSDLTFAKVVADQMDDYLHAEVLFFPVGTVNGMQMPQLTIGGWLEIQWRLNALHSTNPAQIDAALNAAQTEVRKIRNSASDLYQNKARREFKSRLDTWEAFLDDRRNATTQLEPYNEPDSAYYPAQVHHRFKLELLKDDVPQSNDQLARLRALDERLLARFKPGQFVWAPELAQAAPPDKYWFLYAG